MSNGKVGRTDTERLDWLGYVKHGFVRGTDFSRWTIESPEEGLRTIRQAIDAAMGPVEEPDSLSVSELPKGDAETSAAGLERAIRPMVDRLGVVVESLAAARKIGKWWEMAGYHRILTEAVYRIAAHRKRAVKCYGEGLDAQSALATERSEANSSPSPEKGGTIREIGTVQGLEGK